MPVRWQPLFPRFSYYQALRWTIATLQLLCTNLRITGESCTIGAERYHVYSLRCLRGSKLSRYVGLRTPTLKCLPSSQRHPESRSHQGFDGKPPFCLVEPVMRPDGRPKLMSLNKDYRKRARHLTYGFRTLSEIISAICTRNGLK